MSYMTHPYNPAVLTKSGNYATSIVLHVHKQIVQA